MLSSWCYYTYDLFSVLPHGCLHARKKASAIRKRSKYRQLPVLLAGLVDFQKAQCFFMIVVEIATQVVIRIDLLDSMNRKQLSNIYAMIYVVSNTGTLPTSSTLSAQTLLE